MASNDDLTKQSASDILELAANDIYESVIDDENSINDNEDTIWLREQRLLNKSTKWLRRPSVLMVCVTVFMFSFAYSLILSSELILKIEKACNAIKNSTTTANCNHSQVQITISNLQMAVTISQGLISTLTAGKIGEYSDIYGRKKMILCLVTFSFMGKLILVNLLKPSTNHFYFYGIIATEFFTQLMGGMFTLIALVNSYITDVVEPHERIYSLGLGIASFFIGMSVGPLMGNVIVDLTGSNIFPLVANCFIQFLLILFIIFVLPESRSENARRKSRTASFPNLGDYLQQERERKAFNFKKMFNFLSPLKLLILPKMNNSYVPRTNVLLLLVIEVTVLAAGASAASVIMLYATFHFNWNAITLGYFMTIAGASRALVLIVISPIFISALKSKFKLHTTKIDNIDFTVIFTSIIFEILGSILLIAAPSTKLFLTAISISSVGSLVSPSVHSIIIKYSEEYRSGEIFGALSVLKNFLNLVAPPSLLFIYTKTLTVDPKFCFYIMLTLYIISFVASILLLRNMKLENQLRHMEFGILDSTDVSPNSSIRRGSMSSLSSITDSRKMVPSISELHRKNSFIDRGRGYGSIS